MPLAAAAEIVRLEPPLFVSVSVSDFELPTVTLPKLKLVGFADSVPGVTPVPESAMFSGELEASEIIARLPLTAPVAVGANFTEKLALCPAAIDACDLALGLGAGSLCEQRQFRNLLRGRRRSLFLNGSCSLGPPPFAGVSD